MSNLDHSCGPDCQQPLCVANRRVRELEATITELTALLEAAACPECGIGKEGAYFDNMGEVHQCQWCYETKAALKGVNDV